MSSAAAERLAEKHDVRDVPKIDLLNPPSGGEHQPRFKFRVSHGLTIAEVIAENYSEAFALFCDHQHRWPAVREGRVEQLMADGSWKMVYPVPLLPASAGPRKSPGLDSPVTASDLATMLPDIVKNIMQELQADAS